MTQSLVVAAEQRQADRDQAAAVGEAEGRATLALLRQLRHDDWQRRTDATEWDVRTLVSHLVAQAEDAIRLRTTLRREVVGRLRHRDKIPVDGHMAVGVEEHRSDAGPELVERFAVLCAAAPVALELTGPAGGAWLIGSGDPAAVVRADAAAYLRALSGRDDNVELELVSGDAAALTPLRRARIPF